MRSVHLLCCAVVEFSFLNTAPAEEWSITFPAGREMGTLIVLRQDASPHGLVEEGRLPAKGRVTVPANRLLQYLFTDDRSDEPGRTVDLSVLDQFPPTVLRALLIHADRLVPSELARLTRHVGLKRLELTYGATDESMEVVGQLRQLEKLLLNGAKVTDEGLYRIRGLHSLLELEVRNKKITSDGLAHLASLSSLRSLRLSWNPGLGDEGLSHLTPLKELRTLELNHTAVTGEGLAHLRVLPNLEKLGLWKTEVDDDGLRHLDGMTTLRALNLCDTQVRGEGLVYLAKSTLTRLDLSYTGVTDEGFAALPNLDTLERVNLRFTSITDESLKRLESFQNLQELYLKGSKVTDEGVAAFRKARPTCKAFYK